jgi:hypothetical protein
MRSVSAGLPGPEREVLALLVESGLGYDGIGKLLGIDRDGVASIAARARLRLAGVEPPARCRGHVAALAGRIDGEDAASPDPDCPSCPGLLEAMRAADAAYRAWEPGALPAEVRSRIRDAL